MVVKGYPSVDMQVDSEYKMNTSGTLKILAYNHAKSVEVVFPATGYQTTTTASCIRRSSVKDRLLPCVYGVGFLGEGRVDLTQALKNIAYKRWKYMLRRCYSGSFPSYKGCTVEDAWLDFSVFAIWFKDNYIEGYELDKDYKVRGNKCYGEKYCQFLPSSTNKSSNSKDWSFISPEGELVEGFNLASFCDDNNLSARRMSDVRLGHIKQHKGWTKV